jgi:hypothetical protein
VPRGIKRKIAQKQAASFTNGIIDWYLIIVIRILFIFVLLSLTDIGTIVFVVNRGIITVALLIAVMRFVIILIVRVATVVILFLMFVFYWPDLRLSLLLLMHILGQTPIHIHGSLLNVHMSGCDSLLRIEWILKGDKAKAHVQIVLHLGQMHIQDFSIFGFHDFANVIFFGVKGKVPDNDAGFFLQQGSVIVLVVLVVVMLLPPTVPLVRLFCGRWRRK